MEFSVTGALCLRDWGTKFASVEMAEIVLLRNRSYEVPGLGRQAVFFVVSYVLYRQGGLGHGTLGNQEASSLVTLEQWLASLTDDTAHLYLPN